MATTKSADGTTIAYDRVGAGPPLILVVSAFNTRASFGPLAAALADELTVLNYDRRGRGDSSDTQPYAIDREVEDMAALIDEAGGSAAVFGHSSGATLALIAAAHGNRIDRLVLYEPPFVVDGSRPPLARDLPERLTGLVDAGRRGDAVELYQTEAVGIPEDVVVQLRNAPFRPSLEALAHTLAYDAAIVGDLTLPTELLRSVSAPSLVITGEDSPPLLRNAAQAVVGALPDGRLCTLAGQSHDIAPVPTAAAIKDFLGAAR